MNANINNGNREKSSLSFATYEEAEQACFTEKTLAHKKRHLKKKSRKINLKKNEPLEFHYLSCRHSLSSRVYVLEELLFTAIDDSHIIGAEYIWPSDFKFSELQDGFFTETVSYLYSGQGKLSNSRFKNERCIEYGKFCFKSELIVRWDKNKTKSLQYFYYR